MNKKEFYNKKAGFDYQILEDYEGGIVLTGLEIKAVRSGRIDITGSHIRVIGGEAFWLGGNFNVVEGDMQRTKKLLLHKEELKRLIGKSEEKGLTIVPLKLYIKRGKAKLLIALAKGKKIYDKRETIKKREQEIEQQREFRGR